MIVLALLVGGGCDEHCGSIPEPPEGIAGAYVLSHAIPKEAKAVVFAEELQDLLVGTERLFRTLPVELPGTDRPSVWESGGAKLDAPAVGFWHDEQWVVVGWIDPQAERNVEEWPVRGQRREVETAVRRGVGWREIDDEENWQSWASSDRRRIARGWALDEDARPFDEEIWHLEEAHRWEVDRRQHVLRRAEEMPTAFHGVIDGRAMLPVLGGEGQAGWLAEILLEQVEELYWAVRPGEQDQSVRFQLYTPGHREIAPLLGELGEATAPLPDLGGLFQPEMPAVFRLSVDSHRLAELLRRTLDADQQEKLEATLTMLQQELAIDVERDVIANLTGQVAVVVFGLEAPFFETRGLEFIASLTRLHGTRDALVAPIEDRQAMQSVLDGATQLSRGRLRRQQLERTIQYAWFDDGALEWALILSDDYLVLLDSIVAFDHVASWQLGGGGFDEALVARRVDAMMEARRGMGLYVDVSALIEMAQAEDDKQPEWIDWLRPFEAIRVETDVDGRKEFADFEFWLSDTEEDHSW